MHQPGSPTSVRPGTEGQGMSSLSAAQLSALEQLLIERAKQLADEVEAARQSARQRSGLRTREVIDRKADATSEAEVEVEFAENERDLTELKDIQSARARLSDGRYGICTDCEEPIAFARLRAQPAAQRCTDCQTRFEARLGHPR